MWQAIRRGFLLSELDYYGRDAAEYETTNKWDYKFGPLQSLLSKYLQSK